MRHILARDAMIWSHKFYSVFVSLIVVAAAFAGPWSVPTGGGPINGESNSFGLQPNGSSTQNIVLKAMDIQ